MAKSSVGRHETSKEKRKPPTPRARSFAGKEPHDYLREILTVAQERGLLSGSRTLVIRGRMPTALVEQAKRRTGIVSDSKLLEAALANLAVSDDYAQWLLAQRGTVSSELDLEF